MTILANAALLSAHNPVRILAYTEFADATIVARVPGILAAAAAARGRNVNVTAAGPGRPSRRPW
jgi:hypothetical protein